MHAITSSANEKKEREREKTKESVSTRVKTQMHHVVALTFPLLFFISSACKASFSSFFCFHRP